MRSICAVILFMCVLKISAENVWLNDLESPEGLDMGLGVALKLNKNKIGKNVPALERMSLDLNIGDVAGVSLGNPRRDGVELDFFVKKDINSIGEGRKKKGNGYGGGKQMIQMIIGYKAALMASIGFAIMKVLTMKAIFLAKAALIISLIVFLLKLKDNKPMELIEVEQHPSHVPVYGGYGHHYGVDQHGYGAGIYNHQGYGREAQPSNTYPDIVYAPGAIAAETDSHGAYSSLVPNDSVVQAANTDRNGQETERRKDKSYYRKHKGSADRGSLLSVKKYASSNEI